MILTTAEVIELDMDDRAFLKAFLDNERGQRVMKAAAHLAPVTKDVGSGEEIIASAHQRKGFELFAETLYSFIARSEEGLVATPASDYPPLDDDEKWKTEEKKA